MKPARIFAIALLAATLSAPAQQPAPKPLDLLLQTLAQMDSAEAQASVLRGINASLRGRAGLALPTGWEPLYAKLKTSSNEAVRREAQALAVTFGGASAVEEMRRTLADAQAQPEARQAALESLVAVKDPATLPVLLELIKTASPLRITALRALASYDDPAIPRAILEVHPTLDPAEKRDALNTLLARAASARALLAAIDARRVPKSEITAPLARQLSNIGDTTVQTWMSKNWGSMRASNADKRKEMDRYKQFLGQDAILAADVGHGRALFNQLCSVCHTMFGEGGKIGPELPGSFEDVDYLLQNILDPNAAIGKDYQQTFITTKGGQLVAGMIAAEDERAVTLKTLAEPVTVARADIADLQTSENSMMPEGLLTALDEQGVRDLFRYLRQRQQVPLPPQP